MITPKPLHNLRPARLQRCYNSKALRCASCDSGMGWIGLGALIASVSYLLYKHPPTSWSPSAACCEQGRQPSPKDDPRAIQPPAQSSTTEDREESAIRKQESNHKNQQGSGTEVDGSLDTTPKATVAHGSAPDIEIPALNLDGASKSSKENLPVPASGAAGCDDEFAPSKSSPKIPSPNIATNPPTSSSCSMKPPTLKPQQGPPTSKGQSNLMPPPPRPLTISSLRPPPSAASSLRASPSLSPPTSSLAPPSSLLPTPHASQKSSRKVILEPGHSPLDWAALTSDPRTNLRGANLPPTLIRVTPTMLKAQHGRKGRDAWTSFRGKVYNITPYIPFHPGGKGEIVRGAGKDSEKLFMETHPWVNWDGMLGECLVGILVSENDNAAQGTTLDEMD